MQLQRYEKSALWKRTLAAQGSAGFQDVHAGARDQLRSAFQRMRDNVSQLVQQIPQDCRGLTVHDITHLDALWEMADLIAGPEYAMTPVESFVFGAAVLLHDSGMSIAAYPEGIGKIKNTLEWSDIAAAFHRQRGLEDPRDQFIANPPPEAAQEILFSTLRKLHAKHAEELVSAIWPIPGRSEGVRLLEDQVLLQAYGKSIGRIAHSHHWDLERIRSLRSSVGSASSMPPEWTLDERKVASLLRCADAAHIDERRAPTMLYALSRPTGISRIHWNFQNKLNNPVLEADAIVYSSGQDFTEEEVDAWWLCFDTLRMIDRELTSTNATLRDLNLPVFAAKRVLGADNPLICEQRVVPVGWRPVAAEIKVSNPVQLARTLGGRNLYGRGEFAPIRELIQNAVDAVRARRSLEEREEAWGRIRVAIEKRSSESGTEYWLHVDDNGTGMSQSVLTGPLLDFGHSLWNTKHLQDEFPGLESKGIDPIGKFGIGFFSIFSLGNQVRVTSRRYDEGEDKTMTLAFNSLSQRPIVRKATSKELPKDYCTRVSVKLDNTDFLSKSNPHDVDIDMTASLATMTARRRLRNSGSTIDQLQQLVSCLNVEIELNLDPSQSGLIHMPNWIDSDPKLFLREILAPIEEKERERLIEMHAPLVQPLKDHRGSIFGRAALLLMKEAAGVGSLVSVGGLANPARAPFSRMHGQTIGRPDYIGVLVGQADDATRRFAHTDVPGEVLAQWATEQARRIPAERHLKPELMEAAQAILSLGGDPLDLPFCLSGHNVITYRAFENLCQKADSLHITLDNYYSDKFTLLPISQLPASAIMDDAKERMLVLVDGGDRVDVISGAIGEILKTAGHCTIQEEHLESGRIQDVLNRVKKIWKCSLYLKCEKMSYFERNYLNAAKAYWVLSITKSPR